MQTAPADSRPADAGMLPAATIRVVWEALRGIYGSAWDVGFGDFDLGQAAVKSWRRGLWAMTPEQLRAGMAACANSDDPAPPSLPEFRARCLGIPSYAVVLSRAGQPLDAFSSAVHEAAAAAGVATASADRADRILQDAYRVARARVLQGLPASVRAPVPTGPRGVAGSNPAFTPCPPEVAARHMDRLRTILAGRDPSVQG